MVHIVLVESNTPDIVAAGLSAATPFRDTFSALNMACSVSVVEPYAQPCDPGVLDEADGVVLTGSGVRWAVDDARAKPLADLAEQVFDRGLPVWGSCNGMQLAAVLLGGTVRVSPNGRETGFARSVVLTEQGQGHPMMAGRETGYSVPCTHRDEVGTLPEGAELVAGNAHSPVQAFAYAKNGVDFWGAQYHPEFSAAFVAGLVAYRSDGSAETQDLIDNLSRADTDPDFARRMGGRADDLRLAVRATELRNWLAHVDFTKSPTQM
ncbi:MAG: type 1 glutamine amidotransferase [Marinibacterium sp.]|nr:type 1 glutamine amidotransferase [Marinibacterium sp.]